MEYRQLGASGIRVSVVGLGGNNFGRRCDSEQTAHVVNRALAVGINHIDTADIYGPLGVSEEFLGKALLGHRHEVVLASKVGKRLGEGPNDIGLGYGRIMACCENSLRRLGTDYIDLYYLHEPDPYTAHDETLQACDDLIRQGKVRYIGISNFKAWQVCEVLWRSDVRRYSSPIVTQNAYSLLDRSAENDLVPVCQRHRIGLVPYYPLASGLLSGKYRPGDPLPSEVRGYRDPTIMRHLNEDTFGAIWRLEAYAKERDRGLNELAISWLLSHSVVPSVISGASRPEQVESNARAASWRMTSMEIAEIDAILKEDS